MIQPAPSKRPPPAAALILLVLTLAFGGGCSLRPLGYLSEGAKADASGTLPDAGTDASSDEADVGDGPALDERSGDAGPSDAEDDAGTPAMDSRPDSETSVDSREDTAADAGGTDSAPGQDAQPADAPLADTPASDPSPPEGGVTDAAPGDGPPGDGATGKSVLLVVGSTTLSSDDTRLSDRLKSLGIEVRVADDSAVTAAMAMTASGVLVSRSAASANIGSRLRDVSRGVMICESGMYAAMGMVDPSTSASWGYTNNLTAVVVRATAGELAANLSGQVTVQSAADQFSFGIPNANGILVASQAGQATSKWAIFAYESGATMYGLAAPARRLGFYFSQTSPGRATTAAWGLFDAAIRWTVGLR